MMEYKGYVGKVEFDQEHETFYGEVIDTRDVITFEGRSVAQLRREFKTSIDVYLEFCKEQGKVPDKPFSGKFVARIDPELHRQIAALAALEGVSLNSWIAKLFDNALANMPESLRKRLTQADLPAAAQPGGARPTKRPRAQKKKPTAAAKAS